MIRDKVDELARHGCPAEEIVSQLTLDGHDPSAVRRTMREMEAPKSSGATWTKEEDEKLMELSDKGLSTSEMVPHFPGRNMRGVYDRTRKMNGCLKRHPVRKDAKRERREAKREAAGMDLIDRRVMLFDVADGNTRQGIARALPHEPADWIDEELAVMLRSVRGHPPILKLGRDGIYRQKESTHASTRGAEPKRVSTGGRNRRVRV